MSLSRVTVSAKDNCAPSVSPEAEKGAPGRPRTAAQDQRKAARMSTLGLIRAANRAARREHLVECLRAGVPICHLAPWPKMHGMSGRTIATAGNRLVHEKLAHWDGGFLKAGRGGGAAA